VGAAFAEFGTLLYMAPELLDQSSGYPAALPRSDHPVEDHQAVDVWAAACTAYSILTGLDLFSYVSGQPVVMQKAGVCRQQEALVSIFLAYRFSLLC
jgi:serine/threonine protein kinase